MAVAAGVAGLLVAGSAWGLAEFFTRQRRMALPSIILMLAFVIGIAAVVAKPDEKWGEVPCAFVELKDGASVTEAEIIEHCRAMLARFKVPKSVEFCELPKTSTGKIQKFVLRQQVKSASAIE